MAEQPGLDRRADPAPTTAEQFDYREQLALGLDAVRVFWTLAQQVDFAEIVRRMETADAIGPILDPTLWRATRRGLESQRRLIEAAGRFKAALSDQLVDETSDG
jgi:hypothetical protein